MRQRNRRNLRVAGADAHRLHDVAASAMSCGLGGRRSPSASAGRSRRQLQDRGARSDGVPAGACRARTWSAVGDRRRAESTASAATSAGVAQGSTAIIAASSARHASRSAGADAVLPTGETTSSTLADAIAREPIGGTAGARPRSRRRLAPAPPPEGGSAAAPDRRGTRRQNGQQGRSQGPDCCGRRPAAGRRRGRSRRPRSR